MSVIQKEISHILVLMNESIKLHLKKASDTTFSRENRVLELISQLQSVVVWSSRYQAPEPIISPRQKSHINAHPANQTINPTEQDMPLYDMLNFNSSNIIMPGSEMDNRTDFDEGSMLTSTLKI